MTDKVPSAEQFSRFISLGEDERVDEIVARVKDSMREQLDQLGETWPAEIAVTFLHRVWDERHAYYLETLDDDEVLHWLKSQESIVRCWKRITRKHRYLLGPYLDRPEFQQHAIDLVDDHRRSWASRVIARGRRSRHDEPLGSWWVESRAKQISDAWKWYRGIAAALSEYIYEDKAEALINERKNIRAMHDEAVKGLAALEAFSETYFARHFHDSFPYLTSHHFRKDKDRRLAFEAIGEAPLENFYPSVRHDATAPERLLVASLSDLHVSLFGVPKPEAIVEIMAAPFVRNPIDLRTIERICSTRRKSLQSITDAIDEAREKHREYRHLASKF